MRNKITSVKRLSALAQLIQLYAEQGITSHKELAETTGYSIFDIDRAKDELAGHIAPGQTYASSWPPRVDGRGASAYLLERHGLKRAPQTLAKLRCEGGGPRFYPGSGKPLYALGDLDTWAVDILGKVVSKTSACRRARP
jgi:hypothetical protein